MEAKTTADFTRRKANFHMSELTRCEAAAKSSIASLEADLHSAVVRWANATRQDVALRADATREIISTCLEQLDSASAAADAAVAKATQLSAVAHHGLDVAAAAFAPWAAVADASFRPAALATEQQEGSDPASLLLRALALDRAATNHLRSAAAQLRAVSVLPGATSFSLLGDTSAVTAALGHVASLVQWNAPTPSDSELIRIEQADGASSTTPTAPILRAIAPPRLPVAVAWPVATTDPTVCPADPSFGCQDVAATLRLAGLELVADPSPTVPLVVFSHLPGGAATIESRLRQLISPGCHVTSCPFPIIAFASLLLTTEADKVPGSDFGPQAISLSESSLGWELILPPFAPKALTGEDLSWYSARDISPRLSVDTSALHPLADKAQFQPDPDSHVVALLDCEAARAQGWTVVQQWSVRVPLLCIKEAPRVALLNINPLSNAVDAHGWSDRASVARLLAATVSWAAQKL
jgi:hypothetical protein